MPLVETRALTAEMNPTESITTIGAARGLGGLWAHPIDHLTEGPSRGYPFYLHILGVRLVPLAAAIGRETALIVACVREPAKSVSLGCS
jgi:hypothetical protein